MTRRRGSRVLLLIGGGVVIALSSAVLAACASFDEFEFPTVKLREELAPIPIPAPACPALIEVGGTAERAAAVWYKTEPWVLDGTDWRSFQYELAYNLPAFSDALRRASEQAPEPLAGELRAVRKQVVIGMRELPKAEGFIDYTWRTDNALYKGTMHLADASDRVGPACGFGAEPLFSVTSAFTPRPTR